MKATGQTGDRERATRNRAGRSALVTLNHPKNRKFYIPPSSIGEKREVQIAEVLTIHDRKGKKGEIKNKRKDERNSANSLRDKRCKGIDIVLCGCD